VTFTLALYSDIPAGEVEPWSMPGGKLWSHTFQPGEFWYGQYSSGWPEGFMQPDDPGSYVFPGDYNSWLYDFTIDRQEAFVQQEGTTYWLGLFATPDDVTGEARFGWKTTWSYAQWNDAAVWGISPTADFPALTQAQPMAYPPQHPYAGAKLDLSFFVTTVAQVEAKWSQWPQWVSTETYNGWDEPSVYGQASEQIVADDWVCMGPNPVTDVHWWGSFADWGSGQVPEDKPDAFKFTIWSDVPADLEDPGSWSHPGQVLWEHAYDNYQMCFAGWEFDPRGILPPQPAFYFEQDLPRGDRFWQD
jgi:hypothetical protein